jgi:diacylglycerol O-acyltransferase-1
MLAQAPLVWATKSLDRSFDNALVGNCIFWLVFCVIGQPIGIILIYMSTTAAVSA